MMQQQMLNNPAFLAQMSAMNLGTFGQPSAPTGEKRTYDNSTCLYVGNLTQTTFDNDLFKHFTSKGYKLKNAKVMLDYSTKRSKCFGYLNFFEQSEAKRCYEAENNTVLDGRQLVINLKKSGEFDQQANVLVKNLPREMAQQDLHNLFAEFGKIISSKLECTADGTSRGFGYVQFETREAA